MTCVAYVTLTWDARQYKVHELHQKYIIKKGFPPSPFPIPSGTYALNFFHSATQVYRLRQNQFLFSSFQDGIYVLGNAHALHPIS